MSGDQPVLPPLYRAVMDEIARLIDLPGRTLDEDTLLDALANVAMVYEQCCLPGWLFPDKA